ncbi:MAG: cytochrome c, partial [Chromatocurvus sp.]
VTTAQAFGDDEVLAEGTVLYARNCMVCHGPLGISSGVLPDLRWSSIAASAEAWSDVVLEGKLADNGMVSFAEYLTPEDAEAIRAYVIRQARNDMSERSAASAAPPYP